MNIFFVKLSILAAGPIGALTLITHHNKLNKQVLTMLQTS
jgi:hypothetical protein